MKALAHTRVSSEAQLSKELSTMLSDFERRQRGIRIKRGLKLKKLKNNS